MRRLFLGFALLFAATCQAQFLPWHDQVLINSFGVKVGAFAQYTVCPNNACTPGVSPIYGNSTGVGGTIQNPITADQNGVVNFWAAPGVYFVTAQAAGISLQGWWICIGCAGGGGGGGTALVRRLAFWYAGCNNTTAASSWDLPASSAMVPTCKTDGTNGTVQGTLNAAQSSIAYFTFELPSDFTSFTSATINFTTSDTTQNHTIIFQLATACSTPNNNTADTPAYNTAQSFPTATIGSGGISGAQFAETLLGVTGTGCAAGSTLHVKLTRSGADTSTDTAVALTGNLQLFYNGQTTP